MTKHFWNDAFANMGHCFGDYSAVLFHSIHPRCNKYKELISSGIISGSVEGKLLVMYDSVFNKTINI